MIKIHVFMIKKFSFFVYVLTTVADVFLLMLSENSKNTAYGDARLASS